MKDFVTQGPYLGPLAWGPFKDVVNEGAQWSAAASLVFSAFSAMGARLHILLAGGASPKLFGRRREQFAKVL